MKGLWAEVQKGNLEDLYRDTVKVNVFQICISFTRIPQENKIVMNWHIDVLLLVSLCNKLKLESWSYIQWTWCAKSQNKHFPVLSSLFVKDTIVCAMFFFFNVLVYFIIPTRLAFWKYFVYIFKRHSFIEFIYAFTLQIFTEYLQCERQLFSVK